MIATGRGRPPKVPQLPFTNKLLLQLEVLCHECNKTWAEIELFFSKTVGNDSLGGLSLKSEMEAVVCEVKKLHEGSQSQDDLLKFLSVDVGVCISGRNVGPHLLKHHILRQNLLDSDSLVQIEPPPEITNGMVVDLLMFLTKEKLPISHSRQILKFLGADVSSLADKLLASKLNKLMKHYQSLRKSINKTNGQQNMNVFLSASPDFSLRIASVQQTKSSTCLFPTPSDIAAASAEQTAACLRRKLEDREKQLADEKEKTVTLSHHSASVMKDRDALENCLAKTRKNNSSLLRNNKALQQQLKQARQTLQEIRRSNFYKRLKRKEKQLKKQEAIITAHTKGNCEKTARGLRRKIKLLQTNSSNLKSQIKSLKEKHELQLGQLHQTIHDLTNHDPVNVRTRKENTNEFTDDVKKTVISLIGAQVSAENCSRIIQIVAKYMFNTEISTDALPSERTVRRHADQGHFLAKLQVAEAAATHIFDLHADGTSRDKKKFVGMQITTSEGSLSCGFKTVAAENASSLVETTLSLLQELSEVYSEEEQQQHFRRILSNLSGVMTDRASVMKKYKQDLNDAIQTTLGTTESIEFLYCNAHFLLGLSSAASTSLLAIQQELG